MNFRSTVAVVLGAVILITSATAKENTSGLATITREYQKLSVLLQQCSIMFPKYSISYKKHFSQWLIRNRLALKKGELESKQLSAKYGRRYKKSVVAYQLLLKKKYSDAEQMRKDKTCAYLPSIMAE